MEHVSSVQQKRVHNECEQSKKTKRLVHEQLVIEDDEC